MRGKNISRLEKKQNCRSLVVAVSFILFAMASVTSYAQSNYFLEINDALPTGSGSSGSSSTSTSSGCDSLSNTVSPYYRYVTASALNIRSGPGTGNSIIGVLRHGEDIRVIGEAGSWRRISHHSHCAFVHGDYLSGAQTVTSHFLEINNALPTESGYSESFDPQADLNVSDYQARVTASALNVRRGPGTEHGIHQSLPNGSMVKVTHHQGVWRRIEWSGGALAYVHGNYLRKGDSSGSSQSAGFDTGPDPEGLNTQPTSNPASAETVDPYTKVALEGGMESFLNESSALRKRTEMEAQFEVTKSFVMSTGMGSYINESQARRDAHEKAFDAVAPFLEDNLADPQLTGYELERLALGYYETYDDIPPPEGLYEYQFAKAVFDLKVADGTLIPYPGDESWTQGMWILKSCADEKKRTNSDIIHCLPIVPNSIINPESMVTAELLGIYSPMASIVIEEGLTDGIGNISSMGGRRPRTNPSSADEPTTTITLPTTSNVPKSGGSFSSAKEQRIADFIESRTGLKVIPNPAEGVAGAGRQGDAFIAGVMHEFKTLDPGATSSRIKNVVNSSIKRGGQARNIVIDARGSGLSQADAVRGLSRAAGISRGKLDNITIIGDDFFINRAIGQ